MTGKRYDYDAIIIGAGPNGLAAAIRLASAGLTVKVFEAGTSVGGGTRTEALIRTGYFHDICSAIHPMALASPYLKSLPLHKYGLEWITPPYAAVHPLDNEAPAILSNDLSETAFFLARDEKRYHSIMAPVVENWELLTQELLGPLSLPRHPFKLASFGAKALLPASLLQKMFRTPRARALIAGLSAHSMLPLNAVSTSALALIFCGAAHTGGWPLAKGGSHAITLAMAAHFKQLGGEIETSRPVVSLDSLPASRVTLFNTTPAQAITIAGDRFPASYVKKLKKFRPGPGSFKIDYILTEPVPWKDQACFKAGTLHLGGTFREIADGEKLVNNNGHPENPFVLVAQQSLFDGTRTPDNHHTLWAYCHVPNGSETDMTERIENQIERFAPGFRDVIAARRVMNTSDLENYNANYLGGDINGGRQNISQLFSRPVHFNDPYSTPAKGLYFCSSSTPPGGGVHGMCGYHAANSVLKNEFRIR